MITVAIFGTAGPRGAHVVLDVGRREVERVQDVTEDSALRSRFHQLLSFTSKIHVCCRKSRKTFLECLRLSGKYCAVRAPSDFGETRKLGIHPLSTACLCAKLDDAADALYLVYSV